MQIHLKSILSALAFSFLLYSKSFGLNLFLISIIAVIMIATVQKERVSWLYAFTYIATGVFVFLNPTVFTVFVYVMAFFVFVGKSISKKTSIYVSWVIGIVNLIIASAANYTGNSSEKKKRKEVSSKVLNRVKGGIAALLLLLVFGFLYKSANPVFSNLFEQINLDFLSIPWLFFTFLGYALFFHLLNPFKPKELVKYDLSQSNELEKPSETILIGEKKKLEGEHTLGSMIFIALNLLLLFFLATDVIYLFQEKDLMNSEYSESVHQGVYALLFSVVCAIALILYFFRGHLNFYENNKLIKSSTYGWILLNVVLVAFTCYKNFLYVEALGFTYKRIGVFVYLLLTLTGLITAYIKVSEIKNFTYLTRANTATLFAFLIISALIPWNKTITWYNLTKIDNPDIGYLINLGDNNSVQLFEFVQENNNVFNENALESIREKHLIFTEEQKEKTWQEFNLYNLLNSESR